MPDVEEVPEQNQPIVKDYEDSAMVTIDREEDYENSKTINESEIPIDQDLPIQTSEHNQ